MAHLSLQLGAALVVPFAASRRLKRRRGNWRFRALREATAADRDGGRRSRKRDRRPAPRPALAQSRIPAKAGGK